MFATVESEVLKMQVTPALRAEFAQHEYDRLRRFCLLTFALASGIWVVFDLLISFKGRQGFTMYSVLFIAALSALMAAVPWVRKAGHFQWLNLAFAMVFSFGARLVMDGVHADLRPLWFTLVGTSVLFAASGLPLGIPGYAAVVIATWIILWPVALPPDPSDLRTILILFYVAYFSVMSIYSFRALHTVRLKNFLMSRTMLEQAYVDTLTDIPNRRAFMLEAGTRLPNAATDGGHYLLMVDIDNFKKVNDTFGHDTGDVVLQGVAARIRAVMQGHLFARLGGEEFGIYLTGMSQAEAAQRADALCRSLRAMPLKPPMPQAPPVTVSIGVTHVRAGDTITTALIRADEALYASKQAGKDRYTFHETAAQDL